MEKLNGTSSSDKVQKSEGEQAAPGYPEATVSQTRQPGLGSPVPRPKRRRKRSKADRGLPDDAELARLATAYLDKQRKLWPKLADAGLLPVPSPEVIHQMVDDFKERHRGTAASPDSLQQFKACCAKQAGAYLRFSCDNSNPTSIVDQMSNALDRARDEERFIPWECVYADYSQTGLVASRQGYSSYKAILQDEDFEIETTYIDDFSRASRDEIEWWRLAALSKRLRKRMIGASDNFDLNSPNADIMISVFGLVSRFFLRSLQEKVRRGMGGAAERGTCLGRLPLGFTKRQRIDAAGNLMFGADQLPVFEPTIDPVTSHERLRMFQQFVEQNWSIFKVMRDFNERQVDGWDRWTAQAIQKLLRSPTAIGVFIWNKTRRELDREQEKWLVVQNPHKEWKVLYRPDLAIVPLELWRAARRKLAAMRRASPLTGRKPSRNEIRATTLFSGTLICSDCRSELKLIRSTENYKQMGCVNGHMHAEGCKFCGSKSVRVIEDCLLSYLRNQLLTKSVIEDLVVNANQFLEQQALQPMVDTGPLKAQAKQLKIKIERLVKKVAETDNDQLSIAYHRQVMDYQQEHNGLLASIRNEEARQKVRVQRIDLAQTKEYLSNLREILNSDIPTAAAAIRTITGPITVRQESLPGRKRQRWVASFQPNLRELLRRVSPPDSQVGDQIESPALDSETVEVIIDKLPLYEEIASEVLELSQRGVSTTAIVSKFNTSWKIIAEAAEFAKTGKRPDKKPSSKRSSNGINLKAEKYKQLASTVTELRDVQHKSFCKIAKQLGVGEGVVHRAYDYAHPELVQQAISEMTDIKRGQYAHLNRDVFEKIRELSSTGQTPVEIAKVAGCSANTVRRELQKLAAERNDGTSPEAAKDSA